MSPLPDRIVADLGNSRLKLAIVDRNDQLRDHQALDLESPGWLDGVRELARSHGGAWAISSVNPPRSAELAKVLDESEVSSVQWFRSAADVATPHRLKQPETTGADRALAVLAAREAARSPIRPILVVLCGTAITVERIDREGIWHGGAIAPGMGLMADALNRRTAQLPRITVDATPAPWGDWTEPALAAGIFWGAVGTIRELLARQSQGFPGSPEILWSGGDAGLFAAHIEPSPRIVLDLVLRGVARVALEGEPQ